MRKKIVYIAHPIGGDVAGNLDKIRKIVEHIYSLTKYATVLPLVPYYVDCLVLNDNDPQQREKGIQNGLALLARPGIIDELWLYGPTISAGMKNEVFAAFRAGIKISATDRLYDQLLQLKDEYQNQVNGA
jgi:hypothetical protein